MHYDNPPARLYAILVAGLKVDKAKACREAWAEILCIPPNDSPALFSRLGKAMALPVETADLVASFFPSLSSTNDHWRAPLEAAFFNQQLGAKWESFIQHISPFCVSQLAMLAELIHTRLGALMAESAAVDELKLKIDELITLVESGEIAADVKFHLLRELINLRQTLAEYSITGASPSIRQAEAIVGHVHRDGRFLEFMSSHEVGKRVLENLNAIVAVLTVVVTVSQIASPTFVLLPK